MSKSIKVSEEVYNKLLAFQDKRETFSQAIERLLALMDKMGELMNILEGGKRFSEWERGQQDIVHKGQLERIEIQSRVLNVPDTEPKITF